MQDRLAEANPEQAAQREQMRAAMEAELFKLMDTNGDGQVDPEELSQADKRALRAQAQKAAAFVMSTATTMVFYPVMRYPIQRNDWDNWTKTAMARLAGVKCAKVWPRYAKPGNSQTNGQPVTDDELMSAVQRQDKRRLCIAYGATSGQSLRLRNKTHPRTQ